MMSLDFTLKFDSAMCLIAKYILAFYLTCKIKDNIFREGNWLLNQSVTLINSTLRASHRTRHQWRLACVPQGKTSSEDLCSSHLQGSALRRNWEVN